MEMLELLLKIKPRSSVYAKIKFSTDFRYFVSINKGAGTAHEDKFD